MQALGASLPNYAHIPMILGDDGKKISKRDGTSNILKYKDEGYLSEALLNYIVRLGWSKKDQEIFSIDEMISEFDLKDVNKSASRINSKKLVWLNQHYLKITNNEILADMLNDFFNDMGLSISTGPNLVDLIEIQKNRLDTLRDIAEQSIFFYKDFDGYDIKSAVKYLQFNVLEPLKILRNEFENIDNWNNKNIKKVIDKLISELDIKISKLAQPLRVAITGTTISPSIDDTVRLLGRKRTLERLNNAIKFIESHASS